jgi:predicted nucleotidyltransferase
MDVLNFKKSKTREKILRLFFADIDEKYYLRELERILDISAGNIRKELLSLEKSSILTRETAGNQVYYSLNKNSPIFDEFKKIVFKTIGVEGFLKQVLANISQIQVAFIFGSFAREQEDSLSDIDLLIIGTPDEDVLIKEISSAEKELRREINFSIFAPEDVRKFLKNKDVFLEEVIEKSKIFIISDRNELGKIIGRRQSSKKED